MALSFVVPASRERAFVQAGWGFTLIPNCTPVLQRSMRAASPASSSGTHLILLT